MLVALSGGLALPASNKHKHNSLSPKDKDGGRGLPALGGNVLKVFFIFFYIFYVFLLLPS